MERGVIHLHSTTVNDPAECELILESTGFIPFTEKHKLTSLIDNGVGYFTTLTVYLESVC